MKKIASFFALVGVLVLIIAAKSSKKIELTSDEETLYNLIMEYRKSKGLPKIPLSPSLTKVAQLHCKDLYENKPHNNQCNLHSWSAKGNWTPCCYTSDHAQAECMWNKPKEITDYQGSGYEISVSSYAPITPKEALDSWKGSSGHNSVIVNLGTWQKKNWKAIGVGIYQNYSVVWFGEESEEEGVQLKNIKRSKAVRNMAESNLKIQNTTDKAYKVFWVDYEGKELFFFDLKPNQTINQKTYLGNLWAVKPATGSGATMYIDVTEVKQTFTIQ